MKMLHSVTDTIENDVCHVCKHLQPLPIKCQCHTSAMLHTDCNVSLQWYCCVTFVNLHNLQNVQHNVIRVKIMVRSGSGLGFDQV